MVDTLPNTGVETSLNFPLKAISCKQSKRFSPLLFNPDSYVFGDLTISLNGGCDVTGSLISQKFKGYWEEE